MSSSSAPDKSIQLQKLLEQFEDVLKEQQPELPADTRKALMQQFEQALVEAQDNPTDVALTLANWKSTITNLSGVFAAMQKDEKASATETSDLFRQFDEVTDTLENLQKREATPQADTAEESAKSSDLPRGGMPADLAAKLQRSL